MNCDSSVASNISYRGTTIIRYIYCYKINFDFRTLNRGLTFISVNSQREEGIKISCPIWVDIKGEDEPYLYKITFSQDFTGKLIQFLLDSTDIVQHSSQSSFKWKRYIVFTNEFFMILFDKLAINEWGWKLQNQIIAQALWCSPTTWKILLVSNFHSLLN